MMAKHDLHLERRQSWCVSTDPEFSAQGGQCGQPLLDAERNALVLCVDEKPCVQALERRRLTTCSPNGRGPDAASLTNTSVSGYHHALCRSGGGDRAGPFWPLSAPPPA